MRFRALRPFCVWGQQRGPEVDRLKEAKVDLRKMARKGASGAGGTASRTGGVDEAITEVGQGLGGGRPCLHQHASLQSRGLAEEGTEQGQVTLDVTGDEEMFAHVL